MSQRISNDITLTYLALVNKVVASHCGPSSKSVA